MSYPAGLYGWEADLPSGPTARNYVDGLYAAAADADYPRGLYEPAPDSRSICLISAAYGSPAADEARPRGYPGGLYGGFAGAAEPRSAPAASSPSSSSSFPAEKPQGQAPRAGNFNEGSNNTDECGRGGGKSTSNDRTGKTGSGAKSIAGTALLRHFDCAPPLSARRSDPAPSARSLPPPSAAAPKPFCAPPTGKPPPAAANSSGGNSGSNGGKFRAKDRSTALGAIKSESVTGLSDGSVHDVDLPAGKPVGSIFTQTPEDKGMSLMLNVKRVSSEMATVHDLKGFDSEEEEEDVDPELREVLDEIRAETPTKAGVQINGGAMRDIVPSDSPRGSHKADSNEAACPHTAGLYEETPATEQPSCGKVITKVPVKTEHDLESDSVIVFADCIPSSNSDPSTTPTVDRNTMLVAGWVTLRKQGILNRPAKRWLALKAMQLVIYSQPFTEPIDAYSLYLARVHYTEGTCKFVVSGAFLPKTSLEVQTANKEEAQLWHSAIAEVLERNDHREVKPSLSRTKTNMSFADRQRLREEWLESHLMQFYQVEMPDRVVDVPRVVQAFVFHELRLYMRMIGRYNDRARDLDFLLNPPPETLPEGCDGFLNDDLSEDVWRYHWLEGHLASFFQQYDPEQRKEASRIAAVHLGREDVLRCTLLSRYRDAESDSSFLLDAPTAETWRDSIDYGGRMEVSTTSVDQAIAASHGGVARRQSITILPHAYDKWSSSFPAPPDRTKKAVRFDIPGASMLPSKKFRDSGNFTSAIRHLLRLNSKGQVDPVKDGDDE
ncbi:hypothetical protein DIPPA_23157 [Diplonema papillatum]|nr:hypothetical protein DIPPA_23157 [Diplonema papillatum]